MKSNKILNIIIAVIAIVGAILFVRVGMEDAEVIKSNADVQNSVVSPLISFSFWLFIAAVAITVVLSFWTIIKNPENLKKMLMSLVALLRRLINTIIKVTCSHSDKKNIKVRRMSTTKAIE